MSRGADTKANTWGGGALERGHGAPLEPLAQLGDALRGVGATDIRVAAQIVASQAVSITKKQCRRALTHKRTLWSRFEYGTAYDNDCSVELPLRPSASAAPPFVPSSFWSSLWAHKGVCFSVSGR